MATFLKILDTLLHSPVFDNFLYYVQLFFLLRPYVKLSLLILSKKGAPEVYFINWKYFHCVVQHQSYKLYATILDYLTQLP